MPMPTADEWLTSALREFRRDFKRELNLYQQGAPMSQADLIRNSLKAHGISAYALSKQFGWHRTALDNVIHHGYELADPEKVRKVAEALDLTPDQMYNASGKLAPDMVHWLCAHPGHIVSIRALMKGI